MDKMNEVAYDYAREHGILGQDYNQIYDAVKYGYKKGQDDLIEKAITWLSTAMYPALGGSLLSSFEQAMKNNE